ncbi:hypothetical protein BRADI_3g29460v3 [Brachypodium distachyon]|uniref:GRAM domain-containing protein n=1 Tax=Brachypodium distachyon TaxID=15368 RepID=A0A0Q3IA89_BRADI|nr:hypothetical protein BRADI_3g29460v3 [Brachypodium distachyon]
MEGFSQKHVIGIPLASFAYADEETQGKLSCSALVHKKDKKNSIIYRMSRLSQKTESYVQGFKEHITLGSNLSETVKGKLILGAKVLQAGSMEKVFRQYFPVKKDEKLLKAFQCYLSTTAGPIAGMIFISTEKIAFHSDRPLDFTSPKGRVTRVPYKVIKLNPLVNSLIFLDKKSG